MLHKVLPQNRNDLCQMIVRKNSAVHMYFSPDYYYPFGEKHYARANYNYAFVMIEQMEVKLSEESRPSYDNLNASAFVHLVKSLNRCSYKIQITSA